MTADKPLAQANSTYGPVRPATGRDLPTLAEVSRAADTLFHVQDLYLPPDDPETTLRAAEHVLVVGDPAVGFATIDTVDGAAHLGQLAVHPAHGRRGLGAALLQAAVSWAAAQGREAMTLTTFRDVPWNGPWYARRGFVELPEPAWGPELRRLWREEADAGIGVAPRIAMRRGLLSRPLAADRPGCP